jgi:hypothetical protein
MPLVTVTPLQHTLRIEWSAPPDQSFQLEYKASLNDYYWLPAAPPILGPAKVELPNSPSAAGARFYRTRLVPGG